MTDVMNVSRPVLKTGLTTMLPKYLNWYTTISIFYVHLCKSEALVCAFFVFIKSLERSLFSSVLASTAADRAWLCSAIPNKRLNTEEQIA